MANVPDTKKVADLVNAAALAATAIRAQVAALKLLRTTYLAVNPSTVGTPLAGNLAALSNSIDALDTESAKAVWTTMIDAYEPTHKGSSL